MLQQIAAGNRVVNLDKLTYAANQKHLASVENHENYHFILGDICDAALVKQIFTENKPDFVVNFAAESHVDNSILSPHEFIKTNIEGVFTMLQAAREYWQNLKGKAHENFRFLHVSTDEVFGSLEFTATKFSEDSRYEPSSPYSASKAASDHLVRAWNRTYGLPTIITNCSNNFGPRQHIEKLIPKIIRNCLNEKKIPIYGDGTNIRDWIWVEDHCRGIALALEKGEPSETYLFGGDCEKNNLEIVTIICELMDEIHPRKNGAKHIELIEFVVDRAGHDLRYAVSNEKSQHKLGFEPTPDFNANLRKTIKFYMTH